MLQMKQLRRGAGLRACSMVRANEFRIQEIFTKANGLADNWMAKESIKPKTLARIRAHLGTVWSMGSELELTREAIKSTLASGKTDKEAEEEFLKITRRGTSMRACGKMISNGVQGLKQITSSRYNEVAILNEGCKMDTAKL